MSQQPSLEERLSDDLKAAMRAGDEVRRDTIRMLRSSLHNLHIERGRSLNQEEELSVVSRLVKQHHESIEQFERGGRPDLVAREQAELAVLEAYLPSQLDAEQVEAEVRRAIEATGASGPREQGKVMSWLAPQLRGKTDLRQVSQVVQRLLAER